MGGLRMKGGVQMKATGILVALAAVVGLAVPAPLVGVSLSVAQTIDRELSSYVLFALDELDFKGGNTPACDRGHVLGGNVCTNVDGNLGDSNASVAVGLNGLFRMSDGTQLVGGSIRLGEESSVYDVYVERQMGVGWGNPTSPCGGPTVRGTVYTISNAVDLPVIPVEQLTTAELCDPFEPVGTVDVTVTPDNSPLDLAPGAYQDIQVQNGTTLRLSAGVYTVRRFTTGQSVNVYTVPGTIIHVWGDGDPNAVDFNLGGNGSFFGSEDPSVESVACICVSDIHDNSHVQFSDNGEFWGVIIAPNASVNVGRNFTHYGRFVGRTIGSDFNTNVTHKDCTGVSPVGHTTWGRVKALYR